MTKASDAGHSTTTRDPFAGQRVSATPRLYRGARTNARHLCGLLQGQGRVYGRSKLLLQQRRLLPSRPLCGGHLRMWRTTSRIVGPCRRTLTAVKIGNNR
jgi:hypothetical protein